MNTCQLNIWLNARIVFSVLFSTVFVNEYFVHVCVYVRVCVCIKYVWTCIDSRGWHEVNEVLVV